MTPEELLHRLGELTEGLLFPSETDEPIEPYRWTDGPPSPDIVRAELDVPVSMPIQTESPEELLAPLLAPPEDGGAPPEEAARYREILGLLHENLEELQVHLVGKYDVQVLILGRHASGEWLGLRTRLVET